MCVNVGTSSAVGDMSDLRKVSCVQRYQRTAANGDERRAQATGAERQRDAMAREGARCVPAKASGA
ncbi:hypothetical protein M218_09070 [Burkholderia pseudomallei MSHR338]|nr:hypothetical protein M218_09070 [Burkholderia pseudomallei MSHR338]ONB93564.1 hypothetical protein AQ906_30085 [Burkholderia pseudomallei]